MALSFCNNVKNVIAKLDETKYCLNYILHLLEESGGTSLPLHSLQNFEPILNKYLEATNYGLSRIHNLISDRVPFVEWVPDKKILMEMTWETGITPWSFWLKYKHQASEINELIKAIKKKYCEGDLENLASPSLGLHVLICSPKRTYRGVITNIGSRIQVTNVDDGKEREEALESCYKLSNEFCTLHANVIRCCIGRVDIENSWKTEYSQDFVSILQYSSLTVKVLDKKQAPVPTYVIDLYAINEDSESEISVSEWIFEKCVGDVRPEENCGSPKPASSDNDFNLSENQGSSECKSFPTSCKDEVSNNRLLKVTQTVNLDSKPCIKMESPKIPFMFETVVNVPEFSPSSTPINAKVENDKELEGRGYRQTKTDNVLSLACGLNELSTKSSIVHGPPTLTNGTLNKENEVSNRFLKLAKTVNSDCKNLIQKKEMPTNKTKEPFKFESVIDAPEFLPINGSKKGPETITENFGKMNGFHEITVMPGNYIPKDDERICAYYAHSGYCWKLGCSKEHVKANDKWTNDQEDIYKDTFARVKLPHFGSELQVVVTHISSPNTFYVHLPDMYSAAHDGQTLEHLISDLNRNEFNPESSMLSTPSCLGEFIIAFSSRKKLWLRANVCDVVDDDLIQVFFVDFGITEDVCLTKCRKILPQHNHLPSQAVYCVLSKVYTETSENSVETLNAIKFMEDYMLNKTIDIVVQDRNVPDNKLEVKAELGSVLINEFVVKKGFCLKF